MKLHRSLIAAATSAGTLIVFTGIACTLVFTGVAHATSAPVDLSPEYTWMGTVDQAIAEAAVVEVAEATVEHSDAAEATETVVDSNPATQFDGIAGHTGTGGLAEVSGAPRNIDRRMLSCDTGGTTGPTTFIAGSLTDADAQIADGHCTVVG